MILSHDLGTTGDKATLVSPAGHVVGSTSWSYPADFGPNGKAEQDPADWWRAVTGATRELLERTGVPPQDVLAVSFSGQMMGVVPVDGRGEVVRPAIIWADTRSTREADALVAAVGMDWAYGVTGHRLNPTYSLSKMMWLREVEPDRYADVATFLQAKDYVVMRLTGERLTDRSDASGTNAYDQRNGRWSEDLLTAAGVARSLLPEIVESTTVAGRVTAAAASETGLLAGTPVVIGGGDGPMAALGAGIVDETSGAYAYFGSSSWVSISADAPLHDPLMRSMTFDHVVPDRFVPTATMQTGGAAMQWIVSVLSESEREPQYDRLLSDAGTASAATDGLFFLPHLLGERSPYWNARARGGFVGIQLHHDRAALTRAVLEGVAFNLRSGLMAFADNGRPVSAIDVIGGGAAAGPLLDVATDVWNMPVRTRELVSEANALGAAIVGGVAVGVFGDYDVAQQFSTSREVRTPSASRAAAYEQHYRTFLDAYRRLEPWFEALTDR